MILNSIRRRVILSLNFFARSFSIGTNRMSENKHKVAICQFTCNADKSENFETAKKLLVGAKAAGAKFAFLPEACDYIESSSAASISRAEPLDGEFISNYRKLAAELDLWISIGSFHRKVILRK